MRIVPYEEANHEDVLAMNLQAFNWPLTEEVVRSYLKNDNRRMDVFGIYANEDGRTIAQVLLLKIQTKTSEGIEVIGGIGGVAVIPGSARGGVATTLMESAHEIFRENDIRICFLTTSEFMVAHALYLKLGYFDVLTLGGAQKFAGSSGGPKKRSRERSGPIGLAIGYVERGGTGLRSYRKRDWRITDDIHVQAVRDSLGFVVRQPAYLNVREETTPLTEKNISLYGEKKAGGYIVRSTSKDYVTIDEIMCKDERTFNELMDSVEDEAAQKHVIVRFPTTKLLQSRLRNRGFRVDRQGWMRLMAMPLVQGITGKELEKLYDFSNTFLMTGLDTF